MSKPYVVHVQYDKPKRYETLGKAKDDVLKRLRDNETWARRFAADALAAITEAIHAVKHLSYLAPGEAFTDRVTVDPHTDTQLVYRIAREAQP